jgi:hypothetical protein
MVVWLERDFDRVSQLDRRRIAEFSDGNFRAARFLAHTVRKGETLASLIDEALFERIFQQRNAPDRQLQNLAEVLALLTHSMAATSRLPGSIPSTRTLRPPGLEGR